MNLKEKLNQLLCKWNLKVEEIENKETEVVENKVEETVENKEVTETIETIEKEEIVEQAHNEAVAIVETENKELSSLKDRVSLIENSIKEMLDIMKSMNEEHKENTKKIVEVVENTPANNGVVFSAEISEKNEVKLTETEKRINRFNESYQNLYNFLVEKAETEGKPIAE